MLQSRRALRPRTMRESAEQAPVATDISALSQLTKGAVTLKRRIIDLVSLTKVCAVFIRS